MQQSNRKPRIALDPQALRALKIWSAIEDKDPGNLISELILQHIPSKIRDALGDLEQELLDPLIANSTNNIDPIVMEKRLQQCISYSAPRRLTQGEKEQIRELDNQGVKRSEIARRFNVNRSTISTVCGPKEKD